VWLRLQRDDPRTERRKGDGAVPEVCPDVEDQVALADEGSV
jgi:hypothetical protein